ncbi:MAG: PorT family protein, partial [Bacteroidaceae bacterium]|nr:PorT family protein [Bacteroidaceae bacterium]
TLDPLGTGEEVEATFSQQLHYLSVPIHVGFHYNLNEKVGFFGELGPYFAVGVGGTSSWRIDKDGQAYRQWEDQRAWNSFQSKDESPGTFDPVRVSYRRWDAGLGFRVGVEYNRHYSLMMGCDWGLTDIYRQSFRDCYADVFKASSLPAAKNFNFSLTLGYRF